MKLIENCNFSGNISEVAYFLTQKGILVSTTDDYANIPSESYVAKNVKIGIWVHLDHQYNDAVSLLKNKQHVVENPLTALEMQQLKEEANNYLGKAAGNIFRKIIIGLLAIGLVLLTYHLFTKR